MLFHRPPPPPSSSLSSSGEASPSQGTGPGPSLPLPLPPPHVMEFPMSKAQERMYFLQQATPWSRYETGCILCYETFPCWS